MYIVEIPTQKGELTHGNVQSCPSNEKSVDIFRYELGCLK